MEETLLRVRGLTKSFGGVKAVDDVSFDLHKGEVLGVIGPNGSGKTTLLNLITGFVSKDRGRAFSTTGKSRRRHLIRSAIWASSGHSRWSGRTHRWRRSRT